MLIRHATLADIRHLMTLESHAPTAAHCSMEQYQTAVSGEPPYRTALILEEDSVAQGFIMGRALDEEWEIENIVVAGPAQRRGLGSHLLKEFLDLARDRGANTVFLEVRESNLAARRLYEKWAFVESGVRKRYYREPEEDAIVYRLGLR